MDFNLQAEMDKREQSLDVLQDRVMKVKECAKLQKTPLQMQVNAIKRVIWINLPLLKQNIFHC